MIRFIKSLLKKISEHFREVSRGLEEIRDRGMGPKS